MTKTVQYTWLVGVYYGLVTCYSLDKTGRIFMGTKKPTPKESRKRKKKEKKKAPRITAM